MKKTKSTKEDGATIEMETPETKEDGVGVITIAAEEVVIEGKDLKIKIAETTLADYEVIEFRIGKKTRKFKLVS